MPNFEEQWLPVGGYEGFYEVSSLGQVRSVARIVHYRDGRLRKYPGVILRPQLSGKNPYLCVGLHQQNSRELVQVHVLVAQAFLGIRPAGFTVDHKDGNKANNHFENLEWVTHGENMKRAGDLGLLASGQQHQWAKLQTADVLEVRRLRLEGFSYKMLSEKFAISRQHLSDIVHMRKRRHE